MPPVELTQVSGLRRGHPVHRVATGGQEPGHREPGRAGGSSTTSSRVPAGARPAPWPPSPAATPAPARTAPRTPSAPRHRAPAPCARTRSPDRYRPAAGPAPGPPVHLHIHGHLPQTFLLRSGCPSRRRQLTATGPKVKSPATAPTHVLQTARRAQSPVHFPHAGHPWPGQRRQSHHEAPHRTTCPHFPSVTFSSPLTGLTGMLMQPWNPWSDQAPEFLTCAQLHA